MGKLDDLRAHGLVHESHEFTEEEITAIESLSDDEVQAMVSVKKKLGHKLITKKTDDGAKPDTFPL